jgi:activating signal cointegrator complex subunit 3
MLKLFRDSPGLKVVYIGPLKALVKERLKDWKIKFQQKLGKSVIELTGDFTPDILSLQKSDIVLTTPEKWDGISRNWQQRSYVKSVGLIIIDEIHLLGNDRGPILEVIVSRMRYISSQTENPIRIIGLSTALANAKDLADWLGIENNIGLFNFRPSVRPVPLEAHIQGYSGKFYTSRMSIMNKPTYSSIQKYSKDKPVLIFVSSRRQTRLTAQDLISFCVSDENNSRQWLHMNQDELEYIQTKIKDINLKNTIGFGIGIHHAGLSESDKEIVEELFEKVKIQILISTSTLAWGVNLPAHLVIIKGTEYFDVKTNRYIDFPITDILQMMGRAGRPQYDNFAVAVIMVEESKKNFYKKFLYEPFPVESNLSDVLHDHLNAEIISGTITSKQDAIDYLTWTYFFRRLLMNPSYYGLEDTSFQSINQFLSEKVDTTLNDLQKSKCISIEDDILLFPQTMGRITSYYYLHYKTSQLFSDSINNSNDIYSLLNILCKTSEYEDLPVRHNEEVLNSEIAKKVPFKVDNFSFDNPHTKANLLIQCHLSNITLPISDYITDTKSVLDQAVRILQAIVDVSADSGWLKTCLNSMNLMQMIIQGIWLSKSNLFILPHFNNQIINLLNNKKIDSLCDLISLQPQQIRQYLKNFIPDNKTNEILQVISTLPIIQVDINYDQIMEPETEGALKVSFTRLSKVLICVKDLVEIFA